MASTGVSNHQSGTRARTRLAILDAAVTVLTRDQSAPLADIADAAEVSRTTLHRHFTDRAELIAAAVDDSNHAVSRAVAIADLARGEPGEALHRLVAALIEVADRILFLFYSYADDADETEGEIDDPADDGTIIGLIQRGQECGAFTTDLDAKWIENALWSLVFAGCEEARSGATTRSTVASKITRTLDGGIAGRD